MGPILITGSRGFLARNLAAELERSRPGARLLRVDHKPAPGHLVCDLHDREALVALLNRLKPSLIYHMAGTTKPVGFDGLFRAHGAATQALLEAVRRSKAAQAQIWLVGSSGEYGDTSGWGPASEEGPTRPVTAYGASKLLQSLLALSYRHEGLRVSVARVFNVFGPGMPDNLSLGSFALQIVRAERGLQPPKLFVGNLSPRRDYVDVRDVSRALVLLGRVPAPDAVYNVSSGRAPSMRELLEGLLAHARRPIRLVPDPARRRSGDAKICVGSHRKLSAATGWRPETSLKDSLRDTLEWYRAL